MRVICLMLVLLSAFASIPYSTNAQSASEFRSNALLLKRTIELNHYSPPPINDEFGGRIFKGLIEKLNDEHTYLSPTQVQQLEKYRNTIDDELNGNGWDFVNNITQVYRKSLKSFHDSLLKNNGDLKQTRYIKNLLDNPGEVDLNVRAAFLDVLANAFDPHTEYMPMEEKQQFEASLDTEGYYFGFSLEENRNGEIAISRVMPGSPAWKSGDLNSGDIIVKIGVEGKTQVDVTADGRDEISSVLASAGTEKLVMTVKKADGTLKTTSFAREKISNEENIVRGFLLKGEKKIGYIYLPDFYTGHEGSNASCANDVANAIIKLKKENIDGLILDVRYNGGGSLQEALDMAGIFVDAGPLCMIKEKDGKVSSLKDVNRGTIYDGPMTLLLNGQSASASELLGAVLQDYNRAVIVGSPTFGKGSVQVIIPLDTTGNLLNMNVPGFVKVTTSKFYRVNGSTTQNHGVIPDIRLPDIFDALNYKESALPYALPSDEVPKNKYYKPLSPIRIAALADKSKSRVLLSEQFKEINRYISIIKSGTIKTGIPPSPSKIKFAYDVNNVAFDNDVINASQYLTELNSRWLERIGDDIYINEAYNILNDMIASQPK